MSAERVKLSRVEADSLLLPGQYVHTFIGGGGMLIGCDVKRETILEWADKGRCELAGEQATKMQHGITYHDGNRWVFAETAPQGKDASK